MAAIQFENPAGHVVEEVAVVGDDEDGARIIVQMVFQPGHRFGVEVVGRLVEQQKLGLFEQEPAQRDAAALAAGELADVGLVERAAQRVHRQIDLGVEIPQPLGLDLVLELGHLVGGLVGIIDGELVVSVDDRLLRRDPLHDIFADRLLPDRVEVPAPSSRRGRLGAAQASPEYSVSSPAMMRSSVDLPAPLTPRTPILASG